LVSPLPHLFQTKLPALYVRQEPFHPGRSYYQESNPNPRSLGPPCSPCITLPQLSCKTPCPPGRFIPAICLKIAKGCIRPMSIPLSELVIAHCPPFSADPLKLSKDPKSYKCAVLGILDTEMKFGSLFAFLSRDSKVDVCRTGGCRSLRSLAVPPLVVLGISLSGVRNNLAQILAQIGICSSINS
jgi:hypothetical protein